MKLGEQEDLEIQGGVREKKNNIKIYHMKSFKIKYPLYYGFQSIYQVNSIDFQSKYHNALF